MNEHNHTRIQQWGMVSLFSVLGLELILDHILVSNTWCDLIKPGISVNGLKSGLLVLCLTALFISIYMNRKYLIIKHKNLKKSKDVLKTLIRNTVSGETLDIFFIVFFLLHLTWIPDSIFDFVKNDPNLCLPLRILHPLIFLSGLAGVLFLKPQIPKTESKKIEIILSGISNLNPLKIGSKTQHTLGAFLEPVERNKDTIKEIIVFTDTRIQCSGKEENFDILRKLNVKEETLTKLKQIGKEKDNFILPCDLLEKIINDILDLNVKLIKCDYDNLKIMFAEISEVIEQLLNNSSYEDENLLFNLTPGTKYISIALALNSVKGKRKSCYLKQNEPEECKKYQEVDLDAFELKDIFEELLN